tara:strand:+ start:372 stop:749 length:378 start_codon:yes stop_codon:yes gene_type:complete
MITATENKQELAALADLHALLKPGSTIWSVHRHTSASGMTHCFDFYTIQANELIRLTHLICVACDYKHHPKHGGLKTTGCGMDMAFNTIYNLGQTMWPEGTSKPHGTRNGEPDTVGGYAFHHRHL